MSYCDHLPFVVHPSVVHHPAICLQFHVEPFVKGGLKIHTNGHSPFIKMATMPIYDKAFKNLFQNQESFKAESWYVA